MRIAPFSSGIGLGLLLWTSACAPVASERRMAAGAIAAGNDAYSIYDLGATWRDQAGRARSLASLRGRPQLVAMIYTQCTTTCPLTVAEMKRIEREVPEVGFVLVSLDPAHDSTSRLAAFAREHALEGDRWTLLGGGDDDVRNLAVALGVRYRRLSATELAHSNTLTLLDSSGAVAYQRLDAGGTDEVIAAMRALPQ